MSALSQEADTPERDGRLSIALVAAATKIYRGALVMLSSTAFATPGATATTLTGLGRAEETVDNSGGADGALSIKVGRGIYRFDNSTSTDAITQADIGKSCYAVDDHTVAKTSGSNTRSIAGPIFDVDSDGVWVDFR